MGVIDNFYDYYKNECGGKRSFSEVKSICESSFRVMRESFASKSMRVVILKYLGSFRPNYYRVCHSFKCFLAKGLDLSDKLYKERYDMYKNFLNKYESKNKF